MKTCSHVAMVFLAASILLSLASLPAQDALPYDWGLSLSSWNGQEYVEEDLFSWGEFDPSTPMEMSQYYKLTSVTGTSLTGAGDLNLKLTSHCERGYADWSIRLADAVLFAAEHSSETECFFEEEGGPATESMSSPIHRSIPQLVDKSSPKLVLYTEVPQVATGCAAVSFGRDGSCVFVPSIQCRHVKWH
jgi:hypothetical protein